MGNTELKQAFKTAKKDELTLNAELLLEKDLVDHLYEKVKSEKGLENENVDLAKIFKERNKQENDNYKEIRKKKAMAEVNENVLAGFATSETNAEDLQEPSKSNRPIAYLMAHRRLRELLHRVRAAGVQGLHGASTQKVPCALRTLPRQSTPPEEGRSQLLRVR